MRIPVHLLVIPWAFLCPALAAPQVPAQQQRESKPISVNVEVVHLEVTVTDAKGNFRRDLKRENFRLLDEGAEQAITHFASVDSPAKILILVETGPAVYLIHRQHLIAAHMLLEGLAADDEVALATYDETIRLAVPFTQNKRAVQESLSRMEYILGRGDLNLYDNVAAALDWLAGAPGKKALVLLSTGLDNAPPSHWDALLARLGSSEVAIYSVGLGGELRDPDRRKKNKPAPLQDNVAQSFARSTKVLEALAQITGGRAFFPRKAEEFPAIYRQIATALRHQYSLGFEPQMRDGKFHRMFVQLLDEQGRVLGPFYAELGSQEKQVKGGLFPKRVLYRLYFRRGYVAPGG